MINIKFSYQLLILFAILLVCSSCADNPYKYNKVVANKTPVLTVRTTAYSHTESDHVKYGNKSAIGKKLIYNSSLNSAAADWSEFPVGTTFKVKGYPDKIYVIDDYGSALVGTKTIDIYRPNKAGIRNWGVRFVDIEIVKWGCLIKSKEYLIDRQKYGHIRKMVAEINKKLNNPLDKGQG
jgi:3D (Asp-Asp-Asp) domain-containing protein